MEKVLEMKIKETRLGSYEKLYITMVLRILLGQSLKMSVIVITIRNNKKLQQKKPVEVTMRNSIYKTNIECIKSGNKYRASDKI